MIERQPREPDAKSSKTQAPDFFARILQVRTEVPAGQHRRTGGGQEKNEIDRIYGSVRGHPPRRPPGREQQNEWNDDGRRCNERRQEGRGSACRSGADSSHAKERECKEYPKQGLTRPFAQQNAAEMPAARKRIHEIAAMRKRSESRRVPRREID